MWLFVDRVVVGHQVAESAQLGTPRGNLSDLYPVWYGSRELLLNKRNPYSVEVTREIQAGYYGRPIEQAKPNDPTNQQAFAYPAYVAFILAPTVKLPFAVVRPVSFWFLAGLTGASVLLWARFVVWKLSMPQLAVALLLLFASFQAVQGLKLQQLTLLVAFLIAAALVLLERGWLVAAGVLLGLAMIKPQLGVPVVLWLMLWALSRWRERWRLVAGFSGCMTALVLAAELLLPGWIEKFVDAVSAYRRYAAGGRLLEQMIPAVFAVLILIAIVVCVAAFCWRARKSSPDHDRFTMATVLVLAMTILLPPMYPPHYQLLLLPGVLLVLRNARPRKILFRFLCVLSGGLMVWSWLWAIALSAASFFTIRAQQYWALPLWPTVVFPVPVILCLMWMAMEQFRAHRVAGEI